MPWQLQELITGLVSGRQSAPPTPWTVVDLGCGSGLCGPLFRPYVDATDGDGEAASSDGVAAVAAKLKTKMKKQGRMVGVDLSSKMVGLAISKGCYDQVLCEDIHLTLARCRDDEVDLLLSADTFVYVGDLEPIFGLAKDKLSPPAASGL